MKKYLQTDWHMCFDKTTKRSFGSTCGIGVKNDNGELFEKINWKKNIPIYNNVYYFLMNGNFQNGLNFFHFNFHHLQRLMPLIKNPRSFENTKIITSSNLLDWQNEILYHIIDKERIIKINYRENQQLILKNSYYEEIANIHSFNEELYEYIFKKFHIPCVFEPKNIFFLAKHTKNIASTKRCILNKKDFENFLNNKNIQTIEINKSIHKKHLILKYNPRVIIMEYGSAVVNLLYIDYSCILKIHFIFLVPSNWYNPSNFTDGRIFSIIKFLNISHSIIICKQIENLNEPDKLNYPYNVNIESLDKII